MEADWPQRLAEIRGGSSRAHRGDRAADGQRARPCPHVILMVNTISRTCSTPLSTRAPTWRAAGRKRVGLVVVDENHGDWLEANGDS